MSPTISDRAIAAAIAGARVAKQPLIAHDTRALIAATLVAAEEAGVYDNYLAVIAKTDRLIAALGYRVTGTVTEGVNA